MATDYQQPALEGMSQIVPRQQTASEAITSIIERAAFDPSFDPAKLAVLLDVQLKYEANESRKRFEEAFQNFKKRAPEILKTKQVQAGQMQYSHAELDKITPLITDALLAVGITHHWRTGEENGRVTVTCVLRGFGHTEEAAKISGPPDTSGSKNNIQAVGSTITYLERYSLLAACGLAARGTDDDGKTDGMPEQSIEEYCDQFKSAVHIDELKRFFADGYKKAKVLNDRRAMDRLVATYEARKRELL